MTVIDLTRIREALPNRAKVTLGKTKKGTPYIECIVRFPSLYEKGTKEEEAIVEEVFQWQREIIGKENISEFYTEETGSHWFVYLKRVPLEFINVSDNDINSFTKMELVKNGKVVR